LDKEQGWSSGGENSDGGAPEVPVPTPIAGSKNDASFDKNRAYNRSKGASGFSEGPWRPEAQSPIKGSKPRRGMSRASKTTAEEWRALPSSSLPGTAPSSTSRVTRLAELMKETKPRNEKTRRDRKAGWGDSGNQSTSRSHRKDNEDPIE